MCPSALDAPVTVTGGYDAKIIFWNASEGTILKEVPHDSHVNCLDVDPLCCQVAVASHILVSCYDIRGDASNAVPVLKYAGHEANVTSLGFFQCNRNWLYTGSEDSTLRIWDRRSNRVQLVHENWRTAVNSAAIHPNQNKLLFGDQSGRVQMWDLVADKISHQGVPEPGTAISTVTVSNDGQYIVAGSFKGTASVLRMTDTGFSLDCKIEPHDGHYILKARFCARTNQLAFTSSDSTCSLWTLDGGEGISRTHILKGHKRWVWDCVFSADGLYVLTASSDSTAKLWSCSTGEMIVTYKGHSKAITALALFDPIFED